MRVAERLRFVLRSAPRPKKRSRTSGRFLQASSDDFSVVGTGLNDHFADEAADKERARGGTGDRRRLAAVFREMHVPALFVTCCL